MQFEFSAGGLVYKKDPELKFLYIKARNLKGESLWQLPKGKIEKGEEVEKAAIREVSEETGVTVEVVQRLHDINYFFKREGELVKKRVYFLLMRYVSGNPTPQLSEVEEVSWFTPDEAKANMSYKNEFEIIDKATRLLAANNDNNDDNDKS